ncbi:unnamed protein product [Microthlaspi erraticum]|uniref:Uncharacterized protein n=1 Tax=Microthlaspi erraticum TaxID=1685480 RepID=A0A6D2J8T6_9BRAS|nr:unnamed protein product [Microthlaspi erraticum]
MFSLTEGEWIEISRFKITKDNWIWWDYKIANDRYMITMYNDTQIRPIDPLSDREFYYFTDFEDVISGDYDDSYYIDLIGQISYMGKLSPMPDTLNERRSIPFQIKNERNFQLYCLAHGKFAEELNEKWKSTNRANVIAVLSEWRIRRSKRE